MGGGKALLIDRFLPCQPSSTTNNRSRQSVSYAPVWYPVDGSRWPMLDCKVQDLIIKYLLPVSV